MRAVFERKVWSECENGEWNWGETLNILAPHKFDAQERMIVNEIQAKLNSRFLLTRT